MIEPTDEMIIAWRNAMKAAAAEAVKAGAPLGRSQEIARAGLAAVLAIVERDLIARVEGKRDTGLCDCACDDEPVSPRTGLPMEHHCDCRTVTTAGVLLGDRRKTRHVAECTCDWDEP